MSRTWRTSVASATVWLLAIGPTAIVVPGCQDKVDTALAQVEAAINAFEKARKTIETQSDAWRTALPELVTDLGGLEGKAAGDAKDVITQGKNQASDLLRDSISFANVSAQEIIAKTGVEFRCNVDFSKSRITDSLQFMIDDLKFWKTNKRHLTKKPHAVCQIVGDTLTLHDIGTGRFTLDSVKLMNPNIVGVFGYNFRRDALPKVELADAAGKKLRDMALTPAFVSQYQLMVDFTGEEFTGATKRGRVHLVWPDGGDVEDISLAIIGTPKLKITKSEFSPARPVARQDQVTLKLTIQNVGGEASPVFNLHWQPGDESLVTMADQPTLTPGESRVITFAQPTRYRATGVVQNTISIANGDDALTLPIEVHQVVPPPPQFRPVRFLVFWDHDNPTVLHIVDRAASAANINNGNISKADYVRLCCTGGIVNNIEFRNLKNVPNLPNISRAERNAKACIRDEQILVDPQRSGLAPVNKNWPHKFDDELWFIVTGESTRNLGQ